MIPDDLYLSVYLVCSALADFVFYLSTKLFSFGFRKASGGLWSLLPSHDIITSVLKVGNMLNMCCVFQWRVRKRKEQRSRVELWRCQLGIFVSRGSSDSRRGSGGFYWESLYLLIPHCALLLYFFSLRTVQYSRLLPVPPWRGVRSLKAKEI